MSFLSHRRSFTFLDRNKTFPTSTSLTNNNLTFTMTQAGVWRQTMAVIGKSSGKWYWECWKDTTSTDSNIMIGVSNLFHNTDHYLGKLNDNSDWGYFSDGRKSRNAAFTAYGASYVKGIVIGIALDMDAGNITFYREGVSQGVAFTGITGIVYPSFTVATNVAIGRINLGATPFTYPIPEGFNPGVYT
jgi:hypothetical protein